ncbi:hypothetical protein JKP88DRAFT_272860 [Tribonema minus]|uniref:Uncharacterized protein n=1 Tax=Tribonema minus TaxID=303371 RepID=A0A836CEK7_9STRA|nr:hypothetical protein JKP88DRAFT_272860 [Tribonema minus]
MAEETKGGGGPLTAEAKHSTRARVVDSMDEVERVFSVLRDDDNRTISTLRQLAEMNNSGLYAYSTPVASAYLSGLALVPGKAAGTRALPCAVPSFPRSVDGAMQVNTLLVAARQLAYSEAALACHGSEDVEDVREVVAEARRLLADEPDEEKRANEVADVRGWQRLVLAYAGSGIPRIEAMRGSARAKHMVRLGCLAADAERARVAMREILHPRHLLRNDVYAQMIPGTPPPLIYIFTFENGTFVFAGPSSERRIFTGSVQRLSEEHGIPLDLLTALKCGEVKAIKSNGCGASVVYVEDLALTLIEGSSACSPSFFHHCLRDCVHDSVYDAVVPVEDFALQPDCGVLQVFGDHAETVMTVSFWRYTGKRGASSPIAAMTVLDFTQDTCRLTTNGTRCRMNAGKELLAKTSRCSAVVCVRGRAPGAGADCAGVALALFDAPTSLLPCGITLNPTGVYATLSEAQAACESEMGYAFVDVFTLGQRREGPGSFCTVYQNLQDAS